MLSISRSYLVIDREHSLSLSPSPDHLTIEPETVTSSIGIKEIRNLKSWAKMKPFQATLKTALIKKAQNLTVEAQNAMLKILEEPTKATIIVLTTDNAKNLLPTIISRCTQMTKSQIPNSKLRETFTTSDSIISFTPFTTFSTLPLNLADRFQFAEKLAAQGKEAIIQTLANWVKDLHAKLHTQEDFDPITRKLHATEKTRQAILKNANTRLALENLMLKI